ncbi:hypothetical protein OG205_16635 [Lentzea sp. NBC_00516]|uniref:hypothetical protein n=1 Tax=Lentzea sp. NBC_00516 TaxID=2903582 RepID=UPI002E80A198|nr:hypothetical protein [Lentzea sp. NBC_00516]WUD28562.1 hypothetical protein OG205_16635 [Lentzea sp. NBC_00516]
MADKTSIDVEGTREVVRRIQQLGMSFEQAAATMRDAACRYDGCWGSDEFGEAFAKGYGPNSKQTLENLASFANNIGLAGDAVVKAVDVLVQTDQSNADRL